MATKKATKKSTKKRAAKRKKKTAKRGPKLLNPNMIGIDSDAICTTADFADFLGITTRRVNQLGKEQKFIRHSQGHWYVWQSLAQYIKTIRADHNTETSVRQELIAAQAKIALRDVDWKMMRNAEHAGTLTPTELFEPFVVDWFETLCIQLDSLRGILLHDLHGVTDSVEMEKTIDKAVIAIRSRITAIAEERMGQSAAA